MQWLLANPRGYLADAPRVGKTRTALEAAKRAGLAPVVLCPASVRTHWAREAAAVGVEAHIESYDTAVRRGHLAFEPMLQGVRSAVIFDEAHYLKTPASQRTRLVLGKGGLAHGPDAVWPLSGTPMPKHNPDELWPWLCAMHPHHLAAHGIRSHEQFLERFTVRAFRRVRANGPRVMKVVGVRNEAEFQALLAPVMLRREKRGVSVDLQIRRLDPAVADLLALDAEPAWRAVARAIDLGVALEQIAGDDQVSRLRRKLGVVKAQLAVADLAERLEDAPGKVVVFAYHREALDLLQHGLRKFGVVRVDGDTPQSHRARAVDQFQTDSRVRVFLGQQKATQEGLTLHAADWCVLVEPSWTAGDNTQAVQRIVDHDRPSREVVAEFLALAGTLDEAVVRQHTREVRAGSVMAGLTEVVA